MKNLESFGVQELNTLEVNETNGGFLDFVTGAIVGGILYDVVKYVYTTDVEGYGEWLMENGSPGGAK